MGGYTKNLQLYKADVVENANDTFNIETMLNDNWDKIDEKLEKLPVQNGGLYINSETTEEDKAEAQKALAELGYGIKTYTSLEQLGTSDDVYSTTDFEANLEELGRYIPAYSQYWQSITNNTNIALSIKAKILNDLGISVPSGFNMSVFIRRPSTVQQMVADVMIDTNSADYNNKIFTCSYNWNSTGGFWTKFIVSQHPAGFLPLDGSVPMSGNLLIGDNVNYIKRKNKTSIPINLCCGTSYNDNPSINLYPTDYVDTPVAGAFVLRSGANAHKLKGMPDGNLLWDEKKLFGEHNKPSGSYTGNGSATSRTIDIGGIGYVLRIINHTYITFVWGKGGFSINSGDGTITKYSESELVFKDGVLTIATNNGKVNYNGSIYIYELN